MMNKIKNNKTLAFTLAETLMTLAIIGIVAAITIPTLVNNYQKQQYVTQLKKVYAEMSQAVKMLKNDREVDSVSETGLLTLDGSDQEASFAREGEFLKQYFKTVKDCGTEYPSSCFAPNSVTENGYSVITAGGASILMGINQSSLPMVTIDVNGPKKPNTNGRDLFRFYIYHNGDLDIVNPECKECESGETRDQLRTRRANNYCGPGYGDACFGKILDSGWKMDY